MGSQEATTSRIGSNRDFTPPRLGGGGFTLIEAVLIATIISILLAASLPRFQQTAQRLRVEQAAFALTQLLRFSHELSVTDGTEVIWAWQGSERASRVWERADDEGPWRDRSPSTHTRLAEGVSVAVESGEPPLGCPEPLAAASCVHFFPDGTSEPAMLTVHLDDHSYRVTVDGTTSEVLLFAGPAPR